MFTKKSSALMLVLALSVLPVAGFAQNASGGEATASADTGGHQNWKSMTPEQREQAKAARKAKWQAMSPEEKEAAKALSGINRRGLLLSENFIRLEV